MRIAPALPLTLFCGALLAQGPPIPFGSALDPDQQILESQQLAKTCYPRQALCGAPKEISIGAITFRRPKRLCLIACTYPRCGMVSPGYLSL